MSSGGVGSGTLTVVDVVSGSIQILPDETQETMPNILAPSNIIRMIQGISRTLELTVVDSEGDPVDLTGARIIMTVKDDITDEFPLIQKDTSVGIAEIEIINATAGTARIYLTYNDTQQDVGLYVFDVWTQLASGKRYSVIDKSVLEILPSVTMFA